MASYGRKLCFCTTSSFYFEKIYTKKRSSRHRSTQVLNAYVISLPNSKHKFIKEVLSHLNSEHLLIEDKLDDEAYVSVSSEKPDILALNSVPEVVDEYIEEDIASLYQNSSGEKSNQSQSFKFSD